MVMSVSSAGRSDQKLLKSGSLALPFELFFHGMLRLNGYVCNVLGKSTFSCRETAEKEA